MSFVFPTCSVAVKQSSLQSRLAEAHSDAVNALYALARQSAMQPLFQPFRALGYISDDVPFVVQRRGKETFVTVGVGKAWQVRVLIGIKRRLIAHRRWRLRDDTERSRRCTPPQNSVSSLSGLRYAGATEDSLTQESSLMLFCCLAVRAQRKSTSLSRRFDLRCCQE